MVKKDLLLGVDIGTMGSKGIVIDLDGNIVADVFIEHDINIIRPGWVEQDPELCYWGDFKKIIKYLSTQKNVDTSNIIGIGVSSLSPDVVPIDYQGNPVRPAIIYMDRRAANECKYVEDKVGRDHIYKITGNAIDPYFAGYKMIWYKNHESENYRKTWKILNACKYIVFKLTDVPSIDLSNAALNAPFFDFQRRNWSNDICSILNFDKEKLPEIYELGAVIGEISEKAAKETGLSKGTPIISCAADAIMSYLGVGAVEPGDSVFMYGTTGCWGIITDKPLMDIRFINSFYPVPGKYVSIGGMITTGALIRWFRDEFGFLEKEVQKLTGMDAYTILDIEAEKIPPGCDGLVVLPYFMGERTPIWDPNARGIIFGLTLYHTRAHIYRALLESTGYALKHHIEIALSLGLEFKSIKAVNGGAKSRLWRQIISDITGFPQEYISKKTGAAYGDAFLAGIGVRAFKDIKDIKRFIVVDEITEPRLELAKKYSELYNIYLNIYKKTADEAKKLGSIK